MFNADKISTLKSEKIKYFDKFKNITSAMFNTYLVSTLKFQFEKKMINSII